MDARLERVNEVLAQFEPGPPDDDGVYQLAFAILAADVHRAASLEWLAAMCVRRAGQLRSA